MNGFIILHLCKEAAYAIAKQIKHYELRILLFIVFRTIVRIKYQFDTRASTTENLLYFYQQYLCKAIKENFIRLKKKVFVSRRA